jgi:murein hydrolase activator
VKRIALAITAVVAMMMAVAFAQQGDQAQPGRANERLQALQREADRLAAEERTLIGDVRKLEIERQLRAEQLKALDAELAGVQTELAATDARIAGLEQSENAQRPKLRARLVEIYKLGRARYLRLLLATDDVRNLGQAARMVAALADRDRQRVASYERTFADLTAAKSTLEDRARRLSALRAETDQAQRAAARAAQARDDLIRGIDRQRDLNAQMSTEAQAAQQKLQRTVRDIAAAPPAVPPPEPAPPPITSFKGQLEWPAAGAIRTTFAPFARTPSKGIEIAAPEGAKAMAVHSGVVAFAGPFAGFGNLVIVDHGAQAFSLYGDLLQIGVKKGDRVDRGQVVGSVGPTPAGDSGLYFELRIDGQAVDPLQWLRK